LASEVVFLFLHARGLFHNNKNKNNKGQTTVSDARIGARVACEIAEANDFNVSHC